MLKESLGRHISVGRAGLPAAWTGGDEAERVQRCAGVRACLQPKRIRELGTTEMGSKAGEENFA